MMHTAKHIQPPITHPVRYKAILFDADGTLRTCTIPGQACPNAKDEWKLMPRVQETLAHYLDDRVLSIISNQGGIGLGYLTDDTAFELLNDLFAAMTNGYKPPGIIFLCPHAPSDHCACRKPQPKMLLDATALWCSNGHISGTEECLYIGDKESDRQAAESAGIDFCWAKDFFGWEESPMP